MKQISPMTGGRLWWYCLCSNHFQGMGHRTYPKCLMSCLSRGRKHRVHFGSVLAVQRGARPALGKGYHPPGVASICKLTDQVLANSLVVPFPWSVKVTPRHIFPLSVAPFTLKHHTVNHTRPPPRQPPLWPCSWGSWRLLKLQIWQRLLWVPWHQWSFGCGRGAELVLYYCHTSMEGTIVDITVTLSLLFICPEYSPFYGLNRWHRLGMHGMQMPTLVGTEDGVQVALSVLMITLDSCTIFWRRYWTQKPRRTRLRPRGHRSWSPPSINQSMKLYLKRVALNS